MPRIPYYPRIKPIEAQGVPQVRVDVNAAGQGALAGADIAGAVKGVADTVYGVQMDKRDAQNAADMAEFRNQVARAQAMTQEQIKRIPVQDGVSYKRQADAIMRQNYTEVSHWLEKPGNVRNGHIPGVKDVFSQAYRQAQTEAKTNIELYGETYEFTRSRDRFTREIETGIRTGSEQAIRNGVRGRVAIGELSADKAATLADKSIEAMNQKLDADDMSRAELALHAGDLESYDKFVAGLRLPSQAKKAEIKAKGKATHSYNQANFVLARLESAEGVASFLSDLETGKVANNASANHRSALGVSATGKLKGIKRSQLVNASRLLREASRGEFDVEAFEQMAAMDTAEGLPQDQLETIRERAQAAVDSWAREENLAGLVRRAKDSEAYKEAKSTLQAAIIQPERFNAKSDLKRIRNGNFHPVIEAELVADYMQAAQVLNSQTDEFNPGLFSFKREVSDSEKQTLEKYVSEWSRLVDIAGVDPALYDHFNDGLKRIRKAYTKGEVDEATEAGLLRLVRDKIARERMRR